MPNNSQRAAASDEVLAPGIQNASLGIFWLLPMYLVAIDLRVRSRFWTVTVQVYKYLCWFSMKYRFREW
jgi:hypothetical protein